MALVQSTADAELRALRQTLANRLEGLRSQVRLRLWLEVAARILLAAAVLGILAFCLDWWLELGRATRLAYLALWLLAVAWVAVDSVRAVRRLQLEPIAMAAELDKARRSPPSQWIAPRVATVIQLSDPAVREAGFSQAMAERAVRNNARVLDRIDFAAQLDGRHVRRCGSVVIAAILVPLLLTALVPPELSSLWARRWFFGSNELWPRDTTIEVLGLTDGRLIVPRGELAPVRIAVHDRRRPTQTVWMRIMPQDAEPDTATMVQYGAGDFRFELSPQQLPLQAEFWGGDGRIGPVEIVPVDRPRIAKLTLVYRHPRDKKPQTHQFSGEEGNLRLLKKTQAELTLAANVPISTLDASAEGITAPTFDRIDERTFRTKWTHESAMQLKIGLVASSSELASRPQPILIGLQEDRSPRVTLTHSGVGARVTPSALIPLKVAARDDFAIATAFLTFKITPNSASADAADLGGRPAAGNLPPFLLLETGKRPREPTFDGSHDWDLQSQKLVPGDAVSATAEATDDCYTGPQLVRSRTLAFRVVSPTELFREILLKQQQLRARLRKAAEQAEVLRQSMRAASLPTDAEELLRRHNLIQREAWQVMHGIQDSATEMRLNRLGGPETHELIARTVVTPLEQLHDDLLTRQRQGLESVRQPGAETHEQLLARQQEIVAAMQKILKNMGQWDSFIDVVNQLNEVIKLERAIRDRTEEMKKKQFESIFDAK